MLPDRLIPKYEGMEDLTEAREVVTWLANHDRVQKCNRAICSPYGGRHHRGISSS